MANPTLIDPRNRFTVRWLPYVLAGAAFVVYILTLNHWITLLNMQAVARIAGWIWLPAQSAPLLLLVTAPFRWLPSGIVPLALNCFAALCAVLTLGMLARSVAILPHDRTEAGRQLETSDFSFLTIKSAWIPPLLAVGACGLQEGFWENATNFTGEIVQLMVFAFAIWQILEFRLDERDGRLYWAALAYGAGMADDWAFICFFPFFILALIWSKGVEFFHPFFLGKALLFGLLGISLIFFLPLSNVIGHHDFQLSFWQCLRTSLQMDWRVIKAIELPDVRYNLGIISVTSLLPIFLMAIRWPETFGDDSRLGTALSQILFHAVHAIVLGICLWIMFDPPFSPHNLTFFGASGLTFYFLTALSIGYYSGNLLLVLGHWSGWKLQTQFRQRKSTRLEVIFIRILALVVVSGVGALAVVGLFYKNKPEISSLNNDMLHRYAKLAVKSLPTQSGIVMCDNDDLSGVLPWRLLIVQAELAAEGLDKKYVPVDTEFLHWPQYQRYLHKTYPDQWPLVVSADDQNSMPGLNLLQMLNQLSKTNNLIYLNPSFGFFFELFYLEPHGLVYQMKALPRDTMIAPLPSRNLVAENENFWNAAASTNFDQVVEGLKAASTSNQKIFGNRTLKRLHISHDPNLNAAVVGTAYSQALNFWGVRLQRNHYLINAARSFENAINLNPDNVVAQVNLDFNSVLQTSKATNEDFSIITPDQFGKYRSWDEVLLANGPFDEPNHCFNIALDCAQNGFIYQALDEFSRVHELVPDNIYASIQLGKFYVYLEKPELALKALQGSLENADKAALAPGTITELNLIASTAYLEQANYRQGIDLAEAELQRHPDDRNLHVAVAKIYMTHNLYTNALNVSERELERSPNDIYWLFGKGFALMQMKSYGPAADAFSQVIDRQTNNYEAVFNRAVARLYAQQFDPARADYLKLQQNFTNAYPIAYGLAQIASHQHDTNEVIRNCEIYLAHAPTNTAEYVFIRNQLAHARGQ